LSGLGRIEEQVEEEGQQPELHAAPGDHPGVPLPLDLQAARNLNSLDCIQTAGLEALPALDADGFIDDVDFLQFTADCIDRTLLRADSTALTLFGVDLVDGVSCTQQVHVSPNFHQVGVEGEMALSPSPLGLTVSSSAALAAQLGQRGVEELQPVLLERLARRDTILIPAAEGVGFLHLGLLF